MTGTALKFPPLFGACVSFPVPHTAGQVLSGIRAEEASWASWFLSFTLEAQEETSHTVKGQSGRTEQQKSLFEQINVESTCQDYGFVREGSKITVKGKDF